MNTEKIITPKTPAVLISGPPSPVDELHIEYKEVRDKYEKALEVSGCRVFPVGDGKAAISSDEIDEALKNANQYGLSRGADHALAVIWADGVLKGDRHCIRTDQRTYMPTMDVIENSMKRCKVPLSIFVTPCWAAEMSRKLKNKLRKGDMCVLLSPGKVTKDETEAIPASILNGNEVLPKPCDNALALLYTFLRPSDRNFPPPRATNHYRNSKDKEGYYRPLIVVGGDGLTKEGRGIIYELAPYHWTKENIERGRIPWRKAGKRPLKTCPDKTKCSAAASFCR